MTARPGTGADQPKPGRRSTPGRRRAIRVAIAAVLVASGIIGVQAVRGSQGPAVGVAVAIDSPAADATVTNPVHFTFTVTGATLGAPENGLDHLHLSLDGGPELGLYENSLTSPIPAGRHTLTVELADAAHDSTGVSAESTFTVTGPTG